MLRSGPRLMQFLRVLARHHCLGAMLGRSRWPTPKDVKEAFEELGLVFLKFGQVLAMRRDFLPTAYTKELEQLHDGRALNGCFARIGRQLSGSPTGRNGSILLKNSVFTATKGNVGPAGVEIFRTRRDTISSRSPVARPLTDAGVAYLMAIPTAFTRMQNCLRRDFEFFNRIGRKQSFAIGCLRIKQMCPPRDPQRRNRC